MATELPVNTATAMSDGEDGEGLKHRETGNYLPPLHRIKLPETKTQSALVRWLFKQGYSVGDIHKGLNIRYQQVRNMVVTQPKRAAREDLPPDGLELGEMEDVVDTLLGAELERTMLEDRKQQKRRTRQSGPELEDDEVDEITEQ